jgi:hypothetical protein
MTAKFIYNDGGRLESGFKGSASDCVCRAICIATGKPYREVWEYLATNTANQRKSKRSRVKGNTADKGINTNRKWFADYMTTIGFEWVPTMKIGSGCKVHLRADELPKGRIICNVSKHFVAVVDGVIHDTHDCSREGMRCVYGYYIKKGNVETSPE